MCFFLSLIHVRALNIFTAYKCLSNLRSESSSEHSYVWFQYAFQCALYLSHLYCNVWAWFCSARYASDLHQIVSTQDHQYRCVTQFLVLEKKKKVCSCALLHAQQLCTLSWTWSLVCLVYLEIGKKIMWLNEDDSDQDKLYVWEFQN